MPRWLKSRLGTSIAAGTLAIGVVGGLAFAVAGPIMGSSVSSTTPPASPATQAAAGGKGAAACAAAGAAGSATSGSPASGSAATCAGRRAGILRKLLGRTEHASLTLRGKGGTWVTVTFDRGTIQSISPTSITIVRPDGVSVTAPVTPSTKFRRATESSLAAGDKVVVVQEGGSARAVLALGRRAAAGSGGGAGAGSSATGSSAT